MSELEQADKEAMLFAEVCALSQTDPDLWNRFMRRWTADVDKRLDEYFGTDTPAGGPGTGSGELPDVAIPPDVGAGPPL